MTFKEYTKRIIVNGHKVTAQVTIEVHEEVDQGILLDQDFETEAQRKAFTKKIESGRIFAGYIVCKASAHGLEGIDSIGGCELIPNNMFNSEPFNKSVRSVLKHYSLETNALDDLKRALTGEYEYLQNRSKPFKRYAPKVTK